jgi:hypothetical protein
MDINLSDLKDIATIAKPFVEPLISTLIKPKLDALSDWLKKRKTENQLVDHYFENKFTEYLNRSYRNFININVLVLPNQQINIENIYYPLTIHSTRDRKSNKIDKVDFDFLRKFERLLISDTAGMGKSTLMKWIGLSLIKNGDSIPILIDLKRLNSKHKVIDEIFSQLNPIEKDFDKELIFKFLELGSFTLLFDGFDEIEYTEREAVIIDLKDFISKTYKNTFILTSRPDSALSSFGDFQMFHIRPLRERESFELIRKYDELSGYEIAKKLIDEIENKPSQVKEFLINPFLVSLLYKTYSYNKDIPSKKSTFYDEVYTSLYKHHDLSKDGYDRNKKSGLDIHDFRIVLRQLAYNTSKAIKVEYSYTDLVKFLKTVNQECIGINYKEVNYIEDLESNVPLYVRDGNSLKWAHKSIQDYFAAEFISSSSKKEQIIQLIYKSNKDNYLNILDFLYELEYEIFRKNIILELISDFITYCENSYTEFTGLKKSLIRERQAINYGVSFGIFKCHNKLDFPEAEDKFKEYISDFNYRTITRTHENDDQCVYRFFGTNFNQEIINILGKKSEPLFMDSKTFAREDVDMSLVSESPLILDENLKSFGNTAENFEKINQMVLSYRYRSRTAARLYLLDYNKCVKLKKVIQKEIESKKNDLLEGI